MTTLTLRLSFECQLNYPEACTDPRCEAAEHMPDRDVVWSAEDELASWDAEDRRAERRADR